MDRMVVLLIWSFRYYAFLVFRIAFVLFLEDGFFRGGSASRMARSPSCMEIIPVMGTMLEIASSTWRRVMP
jgi:hypothetical protein